MSEADLEKESKRISKSAGLLAAAAVLILALAFQAPFHMADKKSLTANNVSPEAEQALRVQVLTAIAHMDASSLMASWGAIFFCTIAGFPFPTSLGARFLAPRFVALIFGGSFVFVASVAILLVFATGLSLVYPGYSSASFVYFTIVLIAEIEVLAAIVSRSPESIVHTRTRCARLGFRAWCCSLFRRRPGASWIPLMSVVLPLILVVLPLNPVVSVVASALKAAAILADLEP